ncbi:MAG: phage tail protein I [Rhodocyclales bacterium]|nr:phage tail protein I [Rhodocyclales bacterium]
MSALPETLLPPSSTALERTAARTAGRFNPARIVPTLWNADTCPAALLPYLAWSLSVDEWDDKWSVEKKRAAIKDAPEIHRRKGTPLGVRRALASIGQGNAKLIERSDHIRCDGYTVCNGDRTCGGQWASYRIDLFNPLTVSEAFLAKRLLKAVDRNCVHLQAIDFSAAAFRCDGTIVCNGDYTCGVVDTTIN